MKITPLIFPIFLLFNSWLSYGQQLRGDCRIAFYNVENLFDVKDNPEANDEEFLPGGDRKWNSFRLHDKLLKISKIIMAAGIWSPPEIVGLCEVENKFVVEQLIQNTPLKDQNYSIIHKESPDSRGIDVSMIYNRNKFQPLYYNYFGLKDDIGKLLNTREIMYVKGIIEKIDTIHLFFNHWPSRYSGYLETVELRKLAAKVLKAQTDSVLNEDQNAKIVIMGDFNDQPSNESILNVLKAKPFKNHLDGQLINLSAGWNTENSGTIKYQSQWQIYDQVIVSTELLNSDNILYCEPQNAGIVNYRFLLTEDKKYGGLKPFRTFTGFSYEGGFSDHLPVYLDLFFR